MTQQQYIISRKTNIVELGRTLGNISVACRKLGVSRTHYYDIRKTIEEEGLQGSWRSPGGLTASTAALKSIGVTDRELKDIEEDLDKTDFSMKEKALLDFVRKANKDPLKISDTEFEALRAAGTTGAEIVEALGGGVYLI